MCLREVHGQDAHRRRRRRQHPRVESPSPPRRPPRQAARAAVPAQPVLARAGGGIIVSPRAPHAWPCAHGRRGRAGKGGVRIKDGGTPDTPRRERCARRAALRRARCTACACARGVPFPAQTCTVAQGTPTRCDQRKDLSPARSVCVLPCRAACGLGTSARAGPACTCDRDRIGPPHPRRRGLRRKDVASDFSKVCQRLCTMSRTHAAYAHARIHCQAPPRDMLVPQSRAPACIFVPGHKHLGLCSAALGMPVF